jgi:hypothetical protein
MRQMRHRAVCRRGFAAVIALVAALGAARLGVIDMTPESAVPTDQQIAGACNVAFQNVQDSTVNVVLGDEKGDNDTLRRAVVLHCERLSQTARQGATLDWAAAQNDLGNALQSLGERENGTARLEEAVAAYRAALEEPNTYAGTRGDK